MLFEDKKLGVESIVDLFQCRIHTVEPYALMLAPVYVFMKLNEKLVSVKAPLDFFTPDELSHLSRYEVFYIPKNVTGGSRFQTAAKLIRSLIQPQTASHAKLAPAIYEISNEVMIALLPLWGKEMDVDPFFAAVFADELCGALPSEKLLHARETAVVRHENGLLTSGIAVFILLHLGLFDLSMLQQIRLSIYDAIVESDENWSSAELEWQILAGDMKVLIDSASHLSAISIRQFESQWVGKVQGRLERIRKTSTVKSLGSVSQIHSDDSGKEAA